MFWVGLRLRALLWGMVGAFGTAYLHEKQGRDVTMGGLMGLVVGAIGGVFFLMMLWVYLYYYNPHTPVGRAYNLRKRWYNWWN